MTADLLSVIVATTTSAQPNNNSKADTATTMISSNISAATRRRTAATTNTSDPSPTCVEQQQRYSVLPVRPLRKASNNGNSIHGNLIIVGQQQQYYKILVAVLVVGVWFISAYLWSFQEVIVSSIHHPQPVMSLPLIRGVPPPSTTTTRRNQETTSSIINNINNNKTMLVLLYPPGLMGGYRNQVIRLLSLVQYAIDHHIPYLLQNSLLWATQVSFSDHDHSSSTTTTTNSKEVWYPIPMDLLFDIDHWNTFSQQLPKIVPLRTQQQDALTALASKCWQWNLTATFATAATTLATTSSTPGVTRLMQQVVQQGMLPSVTNVSYELLLRTPFGKSINTRRVDLLPQAQQGLLPSSSSSSSMCHKVLTIYGGGKGAGRLWNDYIEREQSKTLGTTPALVLQALQPKAMWRDWALTRCIQANVPTNMTTSTSTAAAPKYVALHARMELEMMDHNCGTGMLRNLTQLLDMVEAFLPTDMAGVLVAVSRKGMEPQGNNNEGLFRKFQSVAEENLARLNRAVGLTNANNNNNYPEGGGGAGLKDGTVPVFECGQRLVDEYYQEHADSIDYGSLLPSMLNFHVATEATIFIGVRHSSYSTDIWTTRYHQGKGLFNFEYTPHGIFPIENNGLPPPHTNCERKRSSAAGSDAGQERKKKPQQHNRQQRHAKKRSFD